MNASRGAAAAVVVVSCLLAPIGLAAAPAVAGGPTVTRTVIVDTFVDDFIADLCGITTTTTMVEKAVLQEWPGGTAKRHVVVTFVSTDQRVAIERNARTEFYDADGTITIVGLAIRLTDQVTGRTVVRDAGRLTASPDGSLDYHGPHPLIEAEDQAPFYCPGLFPGS